MGLDVVEVPELVGRNHPKRSIREHRGKRQGANGGRADKPLVGWYWMRRKAGVPIVGDSRQPQPRATRIQPTRGRPDKKRNG